MALTEGEAADVYRILVGMLVESEVAWLVEAVESRISLGKTTAKRIGTVRDSRGVSVDIRLDPRKPSRGSEIFTAIDAFSAHERLHLLIDTIELGVAVPPVIATDTISTLAELGSQAQLLQFRPEDENGRSFEISLGEAMERRQHSGGLSELLAALREHIG